MSDPLESLFERESAKIVVPEPDLASTLSLGRRRTSRRRATIGAVGVALITTLILAAPRFGDLNDTLPLPPADVDRSTLKDHTLLAIDAPGAEWASPDRYLAVSFEPLTVVCFSLPTWATEAVILDPSGREVASYPGITGVQHADDTDLSCSRGQESSLELLALKPEEHRVQISGSEGPLEASLRLVRSWDLGPPTDKETLAGYQASQALDSGDFETAEQLGRDMLRGVSSGPEWNFGNDIHYGHLILGHVALRGGNIDEAKRRLLLAGRSPGSPQLDSFGPNMSLAFELLVAGEEKVVLKYLDLVDEFWALDDDLEVWKGEIEAGRLPDFGHNLGTGYLEPNPIP